MNKLEIKKIRKSLKLNQTEFGKMLGVSMRTVQSWESGERNMQENTQFLLKSKMKTTQGVAEPNEAYQVDYTELSVMYVPLVSKFAYAGYLGGYGDDEYVGQLPKIPFANGFKPKGKYLCFEVRGDSMTTDGRDSIEEGDIVLARELGRQHWMNKLHYHKYDFIIVHKEDGILVKRIINHDVEKGILTLHSLNELYEDFTISLNDVAQLFNIVEITQKPRR